MDSLKKERAEQQFKGAKKPYATPHVQVYGDLQQLTQKNNGHGDSQAGKTV